MAELIRFNFNTKKMGLQESCIRLYPFVCWHLGAAQSDMKFIQQHLRRLKNDPNGFAVYMGDGGECVTRLSKGDVYKQLLSPQQQLELFVETVEPVRGKILFGIRGNHGNRVYKETGLSWDKALCTALGIPYLGVDTFCNLVVNRSSYDLYFHHGADSGTSLQSKVTRAEKFGQFINADAIFTAHSHACMELQPAAMLSIDNQAAKVRTKLRAQYVCGSAYDSRTGYATEKAYAPILPSHIVVAFDGRINEGYAKYGQKSTIYRADGSYEVTHDYIGYRPDNG